MSSHPTIPPAPPPPYGRPPHGNGPPVPRLSATAVTSLVLGLLGCIPLVTSLGAILFGLIGIGITRHPAIRGRGLAVTGLLLGLAGTLAWTSWGAYSVYRRATNAPQRSLAMEFVQDLSDERGEAARSLVDPSVNPATVTMICDWSRNRGPYTDVVVTGSERAATDGDLAFDKHTVVHFEATRPGLNYRLKGSVTIVDHGDGRGMVTDWSMP